MKKKWSPENPVRVSVVTGMPSPTIMAGSIGGSNNSTQYEIVESARKLTNKPPYRVPSMAEIAATPKNGYKVISTFSGCGGSCLGFKMAGFEVFWASEFVPAARETYAANHAGTLVDPRDIRTVEPTDVLEAVGIEPGEIDVLEGSPPCASFSTAGKREKGWGAIKKYSDTEQRTDDLFFEYARMIRGLRPKVFVAENVSGLVKGTAKGYFKTILNELKSCGYLVEARLLDAQWLGVPQMRQRVIFMGVRNDLAEKYGIRPEFPEPLPYQYSVMDAIGDVLGEVQEVQIRHGGGFGQEEWLDAGKLPAQTVGASPASGNNKNGNAHSIRFIEDTGGDFGMGEFSGPSTVRAGGVGHLWIEKYAIGKEWELLKPGEQSKKYFNLVKADPERPSPTITSAGGDGSIASVVHHAERRKFSIPELKRICAFPDDFVLTGGYRQQWERLGRAVPPTMMFHVASAVKKMLDRIQDHEKDRPDRSGPFANE